MADGIWTFELCDQVDTLLADITGYVTATVSPRLNRPFSLVLNGPSDQDVWKTIHGDGYRYLTEGLRTIKAKRNGILEGNAEVWRLDYSGDENTQTVQIACFDPGNRLPQRLVRDGTGRVSDWDFPDSISAGDLVQLLLQYSDASDDAQHTPEHLRTTSARTFPIDHTSGDFTASTDVAEQIAGGPMPLADLIYSAICDTGVADVVLVPTDTAAGSDPGIYAIAHCVDSWGSDKTGTVHFDYDAGDNTVKAIRRSFDMATVANWLRFLLGPKIGPHHWRGSVDGVDASRFGAGYPYLDAQYLSQHIYGALVDWQQYDTGGNSARPFYTALWKEESTLRVNPRQLLYLTPAANCPFEPFVDYRIGDRVAGNIGDSVGPAASGLVQRIYGMDVGVDVNGVESPGELIVSPDGASV